MSTTELSILEQGTRVKVKQGSMPLETSVIGCVGMVVDSSPYHPHRYGVILDGESRVRYFAAEELEETGEPARLASEDRKAAKKRLPRP